MDLMNRGLRQGQPTSNQSVSQTSVAGGHPGHSRRSKGQRWFKITSIVLLFSATLLIVAVVLYTAFIGKPTNEGKFVDTSKYQAVFLNGGQVYFGHIKTLNNRYLRVTDIWYLRVNQTVQPNGQTQNSNPELVPLGCELHRPQNEMVINREQIIFWENLKDDSSDATVPGAIKKYQSEHPNGQSCQTTTTDATKK